VLPGVGARRCPVGRIRRHSWPGFAPIRSSETKLTNLTARLEAVVRRFLAALYDWLDCGGEFCDSDLVFVHAGPKQRKVVALELYSQGNVRCLLLSMTPGEARNFAALKWPVPLQEVDAALSKLAVEQHAFVWLESGKVTADGAPLGTFGTLSEVCQLNRWLHKHGGFRSVLIISTAPHLRRVRMCCLAILPAASASGCSPSPLTAIGIETSGGRWPGLGFPCCWSCQNCCFTSRSRNSRVGADGPGGPVGAIWTAPKLNADGMRSGTS